MLVLFFTVAFYFFYFRQSLNFGFLRTFLFKEISAVQTRQNKSCIVWKSRKCAFLLLTFLLLEMYLRIMLCLNFIKIVSQLYATISFTSKHLKRIIFWYNCSLFTVTRKVWSYSTLSITIRDLRALLTMASTTSLKYQELQNNKSGKSFM